VRRDGGMPADSFMARGAHGQFTVIIPSRRIVIVKLGYDNTGMGEILTMNRLVRETLAAVEGS
jgi:CubicO group peptidase (beta-lactamase class C family)